MFPFFDPSDPFPLLSSIEGTYEAAKTHSRAVDAWLGLEVAGVEAGLSGKNLPWAGLAPETLLTPYTELRYLLSRLGLEDGSTVVELGAGYARMAHVIARHHAGTGYVGVESVGARAEEARRVLALRGAGNSVVETRDLLSKDEPLPEGDVFFLYDLTGRAADTRAILLKLRECAKAGSISVVGRGRATRDAIERSHPWLSGVREPRHFGNFSVYRS